MQIDFIKYVDKYIGGALCNILSVFKRKNSVKEPKNILIIQLWGIGETICTLPAIKLLKNKTGAKVNILCTDRVYDVYSGLNYIDNIYMIKTGFFSILGFILKNYKKFDLVIDMEEYLNTSAIISLFVGRESAGFDHGRRASLYSKKIRYNDKQHVVYTFMDLINLEDNRNHDNLKLEKVYVSDNDKKVVENYLKKVGIKKNDVLIGIVVGAAESAKCRMWPKEKFAKLADMLIEKKNAKIIFIGAPNEKEIIESIQCLMKEKSVCAAGTTTLKQSFYLIEKCSLVVSNDTGPMHVSAAMGVKTIGLFGPNLPKRFAPFGEGNISIYKKNACKLSPCINVHKGKVPDCLYKKNSDDYQKCMKAISVDDVMNAIEKIGL